MTTWTEMMAASACSHEETELRQLVDSIDRIYVARQCVTCGAHRGSVSKASFTTQQVAGFPLYDRDLQERWYQEARARARGARRAVSLRRQACRRAAESRRPVGFTPIEYQFV